MNHMIDWVYDEADAHSAQIALAARFYDDAEFLITPHVDGVGKKGFAVVAVPLPGKRLLKRRLAVMNYWIDGWWTAFNAARAVKKILHDLEEKKSPELKMVKE